MKSKHRNQKHGMKGTRTYTAWVEMKRRCFNKNNPDYHRYGGRGITVCNRWQKFENFYADMGDKPKNLTLDRIDADGNYEPTNCRWATRQEQCLNLAKKSKGYCFDKRRQEYRVIFNRYNKQHYFGICLTESEAQYWGEVALEAVDVFYRVKDLLPAQGLIQHAAERADSIPQHQRPRRKE